MVCKTCDLWITFVFSVLWKVLRVHRKMHSQSVKYSRRLNAKDYFQSRVSNVGFLFLLLTYDFILQSYFFCIILSVSFYPLLIVTNKNRTKGLFFDLFLHFSAIWKFHCTIKTWSDMKICTHHKVLQIQQIWIASDDCFRNFYWSIHLFRQYLDIGSACFSN